MTQNSTSVVGEVPEVEKEEQGNGGAIAAAVIVPLLVVGVVGGIVAYFIIRKRRIRNKIQLMVTDDKIEVEDSESKQSNIDTNGGDPLPTAASDHHQDGVVISTQQNLLSEHDDQQSERDLESDRRLIQKPQK